MMKLKKLFFEVLSAGKLQFILRKKNILLVFLLFFGFFAVATGKNNTKQLVDSTGINRLIEEAKVADSQHVAFLKLDSAANYAHVLNNQPLLARVFSERGDIFMKDNKLVAADSNFRMAKKILRPLPKNISYLFLLKKLAISNYYLGRNHVVLNYTLEGLAVAQKLNNKMLQGTFCNISGIAYDGMGNRANALIYYQKALDLFESLKDMEKIASVEMNIGVLYEEQKNLMGAEKYFKKALLSAKKIHNDTIISASYNNLANIYSERKEYKKALDYISKSLALSRKTNDLNTVAMDLNNIGDAYWNLGKCSLAADYYYQALQLARKIQNERMVGMCLLNLAQVYEKKQDIPQAIRYASQSLRQVEKGGDIDDMLASLKQLQHLYALSADYLKAYTYLNRYINLHDSIFSAKNEERLAKVQTAYAFEAKDQSLKLAREKQKIIQAYLIISLFALLLVIAFAVFFFRLRVLRNKALKKRMQFVDSLLENSESFVLMLDRNLKISYLSPSYQKTFGHFLRDRKGGSPFDFVHPDEQKDLKKLMEGFFRGEEKRIEFFFRLKKSTGEYRYMQGVFNNRLDNPELEAFVLNFWDITQIRKTQQAVQESEKKYVEIFNAFPDIYFRIDMDGIITEISPSVTSISGFDREKVVGKSLTDFAELDISWDKARKILRRLQNAKDFNLTLRTIDGKKLYCSLNVHDIKDDNGDIVNFEGVLRDITERVLAEKQLRKSELELKEANASKDKILSIIGHDLLGPIGTQKSILDMVIDDVEEFSREEILRLLQSMKPSLDATFTMIENLLSWARIMRRSIKPNLRPNNLSLIIEKSFDLLSQQAGQKKIKLVYTGDKELLAVFDKNLIEIVIRNLLSNAIKFSNPESEIKVTAVKRENDVEVSVTDMGMGLSKEDIDKILKEKEKMESKLGTMKEKGTGLGLIVVKEFIHHNKGRLHIKSQPGEGTTFSFNLPMA